MRRIAEMIWQQMKRVSLFNKWMRSGCERIRLLYPGGKTEILVENFYIDTIWLFIKIVFIGIIGFGGLVIYENYQKEETVKFLERNTYGGGNGHVELVGTSENGVMVYGSVDVRERQYTKEEIEALYLEMISVLEEYMTGENESLRWIEESLTLPGEVEGYPFSITWKSGDENVLSNEGVLQEGYRECETELELTAKFVYEEFEETKKWRIVIAPSVWTKEKIWQWTVEKALEEAEKENPEEERLVLPMEVNGQGISWEVKNDSIKTEVILLTFLCAILVVWGRNYDLIRKIKERNRSLEEDYNTVITRLVLYLGAGMPVKGAWEKTAAIIEKISTESVAAKEMRLAIREMNNGVYENDCYISFGKRCGRCEYIRLGALLSQNLKKGNSELLKRLREEVRESGELRRHYVRKKGEEATTKLLVPMIMLLAMTMILIMLPAFMGIY